MKVIDLKPDKNNFVLVVKNAIIDMGTYRFSANRKGQVIAAPVHHIASGQVQRTKIGLQFGDEFSLIFDDHPLDYWIE